MRETKPFLGRLVAREEEWRYEDGKRDLRLDLLRGFAALVMIADHIGGQDSWLYPLTGGNEFFVSAAEAFVVISGIVMGIVYRNVLVKQGLAAALMKALHRAVNLYLVTVVLTLAFAALGYLLGQWWAPDTGLAGVPRYVLEVLTLHRSIYLVDVMLMYTLLLLGAGLIILLLSQRLTALVLAGSWAIWTVWQLSPDAITLPWSIEDYAVFPIPAWQALFITGIAAGWHRDRLERWFGRLPRALVFWSLSAACLSVAGLYMVQVTALDALYASRWVYDLAFDKPDVPVGRLLVFALLAAFSYTAATLVWEPCRRLTGWLLLPLGQNALTAYSLHVILVAFTTVLAERLLRAGLPDDLVSTSLQIGGVLLVWLVVVEEPKLKAKLRHQAGRFSWPSVGPPQRPQDASV